MENDNFVNKNYDKEKDSLSKKNLTYFSNRSNSQENLMQILNTENKLNIIDHLVDHLHFSRFHVATLFVNIFSFICEGYLSFQIRYCQHLFVSKFNWTKSDVSLLYIIQMLFLAVGALISTNCRSIHWDVSSNILIGSIGCLSAILIAFYSDAVIYSILISLFCVCQGFIGSICTNFLLELCEMRIRGFLFLLVSSFHMFGWTLGAALFTYLFGVYRVEDPNLVIVGLVATQLGLTFSLVYLLDSPRVLFYNNELPHMYEYIQEITTEGEDNIYNQQFKADVITKLEVAKKEIERKFAPQNNEGVFYTYTYLFKKPHLKLTLKAVTFIFLSFLMIGFVKDSHLFLYKNPKEFPLSTSNFNGNKQINFTIFFYYLAQFVIMLCMSSLYYLLKVFKIRINLQIPTISICVILMILILTLKNYFTLLICLYEGFSYFYFTLVFLYLCENTTTKLRNSLSATLHCVISIVSVFLFTLIETVSAVNPNFLLGVNFGVCFALVLMEIFAVDEVDQLGLQEIEFKILSLNN